VKSLCLTDEAPRPEGVRGSEAIAPRTLNLGIRWRLMVALSPRKETSVPLGEEVG
jgi:hypothetical protein